jgi:hypothetical protein
MRSLAVALLAVLAPMAIAQGPTHTHAAHRSFRGHHAPSSPLTSFLSPFLGDSFNPEDLSSASDPSQVPPFLLQATRAMSGPGAFAGQPDNNPEPSSQPLLIELQGDRYVRVTSAAIDGEALPLNAASNNAASNNLHANNARQSKPAGSHLGKALTQSSTNRPASTISGSMIAGPMIAAAAPPAVRDLPAAILIFRDGHSEEVHDYTIADGSLYARGDYYTDGYWNKKIDLSALNLTATVQTNSTRNVKFVVPSSPNEVITRP